MIPIHMYTRMSINIYIYIIIFFLFNIYVAAQKIFMDPLTQVCIVYVCNLCFPEQFVRGSHKNWGENIIDLQRSPAWNAHHGPETVESQPKAVNMDNICWRGCCLKNFKGWKVHLTNSPENLTNVPQKK